MDSAGSRHRAKFNLETQREKKTKRVMVIVKANKESEAGVLPSKKILTEMGKYNEQLVKAGIMLAAEGLQPTSKGARVRFSKPANRDRRALRQIERTDRWFLAVAG